MWAPPLPWFAAPSAVAVAAAQACYVGSWLVRTLLVHADTGELMHATPLSVVQLLVTAALLAQQRHCDHNNAAVAVEIFCWAGSSIWGCDSQLQADAAGQLERQQWVPSFPYTGPGQLQQLEQAQRAQQAQQAQQARTPLGEQLAAELALHCPGVSLADLEQWVSALCLWACANINDFSSEPSELIRSVLLDSHLLLRCTTAADNPGAHAVRGMAAASRGTSAAIVALWAWRIALRATFVPSRPSRDTLLEALIGGALAYAVDTERESPLLGGATFASHARGWPEIAGAPSCMRAVPSPLQGGVRQLSLPMITRGGACTP